ncbi:hypothetical protein ACFE04_005617 [Oxalis oulophora]
MTKPNEHEDVNPGDLQIMSIGSLYKGPWENKYWSSSRGKDRHPYPVGFQAVRAHKGITFKIEVHEGPRGPLFSIISADGHSFSGQTPDTAWGNFKKKSSPHTKIWHGKRFCGGIGGVEFFGFKYTFVQRLLRELVTNVNAKDEKSLPSSIPINGTTETNCGNSITKKRSRQHEFIDSESVSRAGLNRPQAKNLMINGDDFKYVNLSDHLRELIVDAEEKTKHASFENGECERLANNCYEEERPVDRSQSIVMEGSEFPSSIAQNLSSNNVDLCAPDTLDSVQEGAPNSSPQNRNRSSCVKVETENDMRTSETFFTYKLPDGPSNSNSSSGKRGHDSVREEISKSMMELLLPQAVPLLRKKPRKKKTINSPSVKFPFEAQSQENDTISNLVVDVKSPAAMQIETPQVEKEEEMHIIIDIVVPDSPDSKHGVRESYLDMISDMQELSASQALVKEGEDIFCYEEPCPTSNEIPEKGHKYIPESVLGCPSPCKNNLPRDIRDASYCDQVPFKVYTRKKARKRNYNGPLSESIICRNFEDDRVSGTDHSPETTSALKSHHSSSSQDKTRQITSPKVTSNNVASSFEEKKTSPSVPNVENGEADCDDALFAHGRTDFCITKVSKALEVENSFDESHNNLVFSNGLCSFVQLAGCYFHPLPVLTLLLSAQESEMYICVICGSLKEKEHTLYTYKLAINGQEVGQPSSVGQTSLIFPHSHNNRCTEMLAENYSLQFSPDGQSLILLDKIKIPSCREGRLDCLCATCASECYEENALKIVKVKTGYVSVTAKLKTVDNLDCILVCEPSHLIAGGKSGRLHLWTMNSTWSAQTEEFALLANCGKSSRIVALKRIPNYASLVISHNDCGEFCLWDISEQISLSVFSSPSPSVRKFFPIGLFNWQRKSHPYSDSDKRDQMTLSKSSFLEYNTRLPSDEEDSAVWLLVSPLASDDHHTYLSKGQVNPAAEWRLGLLANNMMLTGSTLDPRAAVIGASAGYGISGTREGVTYMWELSTGAKLGTLHHFKGGSVSCIATNDSRSGVFAVAGDQGQLLVYLIYPESP